MRVSDILALVGSEFPGLTASKLRFLDAEGLVTPVRTSGGYRHYSPADVERLRFVLQEQRDRFAPLNVIAAQLERLDAGADTRSIRPHTIDEEVPAHMDAADVARCADAEPDVVSLLSEAGLISTSVGDLYPASSVGVVEAASRFLEAGGDVREIRTLRVAAEREGAAARAVGGARPRPGEAAGVTEERAEAAIALFGVLVRREVTPE